MAKATIKKTIKKTTQVKPSEVIDTPTTHEDIARMDHPGDYAYDPIIPEEPKIAKTIGIDQAEYEELQKVKTRYVAETKAIAIKKQDYEYFADFDKGSSVPAWMLPRPTEDLEREVNKLGSMIKNKQIPDEEVYTAEENYRMKKDRLDKIKSSKPKLTGMQIDRLRQVKDRLASDISDSKFTRLEMEKYLVDAHEEARRMTEPIIDMDRTEARRMGINVSVDGKVSRSQAEMAWKMACSLLGDTQDNPNSEMLRKDSGQSKRNMITVPIDIKDGEIIYPEGHKYASLNA